LFHEIIIFPKAIGVAETQLNASDFALNQLRRRVFLFATAGGWSACRWACGASLLGSVQPRHQHRRPRRKSEKECPAAASAGHFRE